MAARKHNETAADSIYIVCGKDPFLMSLEYERIIDSLLGEDEKDMGLLVAEASRMELADVLDELRTLPFLATRRVVLLKDADTFISNNMDALLKYLDSPCQTGTLILTVSTIRSNSRIAKRVNEIGQLINIAEYKRYQLAKFIIDYADGKFSKKVSNEAAELLIEFVGDEPGKLCSEVEKLALYVDKRNSISIEDIQSLVGNNREFDVFAVIDAMTGGDTGTAISRLRNMFSTDKSAEYKSVGAFAFHFRKMFSAKVLLSQRVSFQEVAGKLRIFGDRNAFFNQLNKWSLQEVGNVIKALARIDYESKTGQTDVPSAIEQLVIKACLKQQRRARA